MEHVHKAETTRIVIIRRLPIRVLAHRRKTAAINPKPTQLCSYVSEGNTSENTSPASAAFSWRLEFSYLFFNKDMLSSNMSTPVKIRAGLTNSSIPNSTLASRKGRTTPTELIPTIQKVVAR